MRRLLNVIEIIKNTQSLVKKAYLLDKPNIYTYLVRCYGHNFCIDGATYKVYTFEQIKEKAQNMLNRCPSLANTVDDLLKRWKNDSDYNYYFDSLTLEAILSHDILFIHDIIEANNIDIKQVDLGEIYEAEYLTAKKYKRLIAVDVNQLSINVFNELGKNGRNLLKQVEEYKYKIVQTKELIVDETSQKQIQKCIDDLDNVSAFIYNFVYDLENYEHTEDYDKQIEFNVPEDIEEDIIVEQPEEEVEETEKEDTSADDMDMEDEENPFDMAAENDEDFDFEEEE